MSISYPYIFLDFDGVIKESVEIKAEVFESLFLQFGSSVARRVRRHHEQNGGLSRYEKLPLYLQWSGQVASEDQVAEWSDLFSSMVKQRVIDADWVPGVVDFLNQKVENTDLFIVTATPQHEIEEILQELGMASYFSAVIGAPVPKAEAIESLLSQFSISVRDAVMFGDTYSDFEAAKSNQLNFILRRTTLNLESQCKIACPMIDDFTGWTGLEGIA